MKVSRTIIPLSVAGAMALVGLAPSAYAGQQITGVVSPTASDDSPAVSGAQCYPGVPDPNACRRVLALKQVGSWVYAAGIIDTVIDRSGANDVTISGFHNIFRFNATTHLVDATWQPQLYKSAKSYPVGGPTTTAYTDSAVTGLDADASGSVFAAGSFQNIATGPSATTYIVRKGVVKLTPAGLVDTTFNAKVGAGGGSAIVYDVKYVSGTNASTVWLGGLFTRLGAGTGTARTGLAFVDVKGVLTSTQVPIAGQVTTTVGTKVAKFAINNAGTKAAMIGNYTTVGGASHKEVAVLDINQADGTGSVDPWNAEPSLAASNSTNCNAKDTWARGVDWSPDNVHFNVAASGGGGFDAYGSYGALCDALTRFDSGKINNAPPDLVNETGFDSLFAVVDTGDTLYTGGHNKYLNYKVYVNGVKVTATKEDHAGIGAIDVRAGSPTFGRAITSFNNSALTGRGAGWASALSISGAGSAGGGVYIGGDAQNVGSDSTIQRLAYFPSAG